MTDKILFDVKLVNTHVITFARHREDAKRNAALWIGGDLNAYIVTPITEQGDRIHMSITLQV